MTCHKCPNCTDVQINYTLPHQFFFFFIKNWLVTFCVRLENKSSSSSLYTSISSITSQHQHYCRRRRRLWRSCHDRCGRHRHHCITIIRCLWCGHGVVAKRYIWLVECCFMSIVPELCESRGGRPGLSVLTSLMVSVDVKLY